MSQWKNKLYYGDNLDILRAHVADDSVDLIYLDPPFNSQANYNVLFAEQSGEKSPAQITAFEDTWHWSQEAEHLYHETIRGTANRRLADLLQAFRSFLGTSDMMAYLTMMAPRLAELHRVLKPTGSMYLHCDPTASHYLKLLMDAIFDVHNFRNEIVWHYTGRRMESKYSYNSKHDILFFYGKTEQATIENYPRDTWTREEYLKMKKQELHVDEAGREWIWGHAGKGKSHDYRIYIDEVIKEGRAVDDVWDIPIINTSAKERLGYPTQKPEALLERIIKASSNEDDVILDPFCGCGTAVAVAERLHRKWMGIDITHLAISLIRHRLKDSFKTDLAPFEVIGEPKDPTGARELAAQNRYQFEWWALALVDARPAQDKKKGADAGIDGYIYFFDDDSGKAKKIIVQVKSGTPSVSHIRDLKGVLQREDAAIGVYITLEEPTRPMRTEAASAGFYEPEHFNGSYPRVQILTITELLEGKTVQYPRLGPTATFKKAERKEKDHPSIQMFLL
jgi:site-specific DNA-methyltransferase (adenine-specific)